MTITINPSRNEYTASAAQTVFNYTFKIYSITDLNVYVTPNGQVPNDATDIITAYTVDPGTVGNAAGGFITLTTPSTVSDKVTIVSSIPSTRVVDYQFNGDFNPDTVNLDIDRTVSLDKQNEDLIKRTVTFEESAHGVSGITLPIPVAQNLLKWNDAGTALENTTVSELGGVTVTPLMVDLLNDATTSAARTTLEISALNTPYDNTTSGLTATNVKAGLDEVSISSNISYDNTASGLTATNVKAGIDELSISDNITYDNTASGLTAADVKAAIDEVATHGIDSGQAWEGLIASRTSGVTYTNSTGKPIAVIATSTTSNPLVVVDGVTIQNVVSSTRFTSFIVPNGNTYVITATNLALWAELR